MRVRLTNTLAAEEDPDHLRSTFRPWSKRVPMGDVFSTCNWVLRDGYAHETINSCWFDTPFRAPKAATKRVFLVTDEDSPHDGHVHMDTVSHNILEVSPTPHSFESVITLYRTSTLSE